MASNPFGGFVHTSPLAPLPHDPCITLASNCIRDQFGPTVQTVADCLQSRGGSSTLAQIISSIRGQCCREWNEERERLVGLLVQKSKQDKIHHGEQQQRYRVHRTRGPEQAGYVVDAEAIRAALLVLVQHSLVTVHVSEKSSSKSKKSSNLTYHYSFNLHRARLLPRYARYVEYAKKTVDERGAALVEELLVQGRMTTQDAILFTVENALQQERKNKESADSTESSIDKATVTKGVGESFVRMVNGGFIQQVMPITPDKEEVETEFQDESSPPPQKKRRTSKGSPTLKQESETRTTIQAPQSDAEKNIVSLIQGSQYKKHLPLGAVWRINVDMFHDSLRAFCLGRLVAERYGPKVPSCGSMVTAALRFVAHCRHTKRNDQVEGRRLEGDFSPKDILPYLPDPVRDALEPSDDDGDKNSAVSNLSNALLELSKFASPTVLTELELVQGHPEGGKFKIATSQLVNHLKGLILHQVILDSQGEVAARICSYLQATGHQESDAIAETAMVPAKDVREVLHRLYRANYVNLMSLQQSKQHNPANAIYLWSVERPRILETVTKNVTTALFRVRLRRQHEMEVGKDWIERAKEARTASDENDHELDKVNYNKFCKGLERLDNAALQLDETLMVLKDF